MLRILMKTASSMGKISGSASSERYDEVDLSTWELVNASQSDDEDLYSFDGDDIISAGESPQEEYQDAGSAREVISAVSVISIQPMSVSPPMTLPVEMTLNNHVYHGDDDVDDDEDDDDGDYDDELVPWKLKGRFGKQRIMKLGKRGGSKPNKSKKMPIYYNRPGCLYGKQGFGVQHSFI
ncbi:hypothetical protein CASFOL_042102 [Castilleja foliolosa]|uniref:Uncharacterized protein n=1 Tax=Castilleja foliolosa TaxID=1961234 RepID=A0ABD3BA19_9LAMI